MSVDYTQFSEWKPGEPKTPGTGKWWVQKTTDARGSALSEVVSNLKSQATQRNQRNLVHARLYGNVDIASFGARDYSRSASWVGRGVPNNIRFNVVATCIETLDSKIGKQRPRPTFLTSGGSWKGRQRARMANLWTQGLFYETKIHEKVKDVRLSAYTFGTGALKVWVERERGEKGEVCCEPVFIDDLFVDDADGINKKPRQMFHRYIADRDVVMERFKNDPAVLSATIDSADKANNGISDVVELWEAWHLPSSKGSNDGRHVIISRDGHVLLDEKWELECFPFVIRRYRPRLRGFWGQGIAEILTGIQVELNRVIQSISAQLQRRGKGRIFAQAGTIDENAIDNSLGAIVKTKGPPGQVLMVDNQNAVAGEEFMQVDRLYQKAFQEVGISELSAASKKPSGLDAAVALREFNDIESERFSRDAQADEQFFLEFTRLSMKLVDKFAPDMEVRMPNRAFAKVIKWSDIRIDPDDFVIQMFPVSSLPTHPGARLQRVNELIDGGFIDASTGRRLLDFPDIELEMTLANAMLDNIDWMLSMILDEKKPQMPQLEVYHDIALVVQRATAAFLEAQVFDVEEERLQMLRDFIDSATASMANTMKAQAAMSAGLPPNALSGGPSVTNNVNVEPQNPVAPAVPPVVA